MRALLGDDLVDSLVEEKEALTLENRRLRDLLRDTNAMARRMADMADENADLARSNDYLAQGKAEAEAETIRLTYLLNEILDKADAASHLTSAFIPTSRVRAILRQVAEES